MVVALMGPLAPLLSAIESKFGWMVTALSHCHLHSAHGQLCLHLSFALQQKQQQTCEARIILAVCWSLSPFLHSPGRLTICAILFASRPVPCTPRELFESGPTRRGLSLGVRHLDGHA